MSAPVSETPVWFHHAVDVRFRDLDPMGHAHHTLPLIYLEEARAAYWRAVAGRSSLRDIDYVMAEVTVRFHRRIEWPARLDVALRTSRIGTKSFVMEFEIRDDDGEVVSSGSTVQVCYDYAAGAAVAIPIELRRRLEQSAETDARPQNSIAMPADTTPIIPPST